MHGAKVWRSQRRNWGERNNMSDERTGGQQTISKQRLGCYRKVEGGKKRTSSTQTVNERILLTDTVCVWPILHVFCWWIKQMNPNLPPPPKQDLYNYRKGSNLRKISCYLKQPSPEKKTTKAAAGSQEIANKKSRSGEESVCGSR